MAAKRAAAQLREKICAQAASWWGLEPERVAFDGERVYEAGEDGEPVEGALEAGRVLDVRAFANECVRGGAGDCLTAHAAASSPVSPPPFMAGIAEVEVEKASRQGQPRGLRRVVDCGTIVNSASRACKPRAALRRHRHGAHRGGVLQRGGPFTRPFVHDVPPAHAPGHPADPRGVRAELRADGPVWRQVHRRGRHQHAAPAIASAVAHATGAYVRDLPITPEKVLVAQPES